MTGDTKGFELLEQELLQAKAEALGRAGEKLRRAVQEYQRAKAELEAGTTQAEQVEARWSAVLSARETLIVLREGVGLRSHDSVDEAYAIPLKHRL